ncbi:ACP S-malonyltransferase [Actinokineospora sp.]|uniref:ACP S-malonyltransferase n=1 Tax=Actinokineospora sp. TaxID=1872133 RepID=UPI004038254E
MRSAILFPGLVPVSYQGLAGYLSHDRHAGARFTEAADVLGYSLFDAFRAAGPTDWEALDCAYLAVNLALADHALELMANEPVLVAGASFGALPAVVLAGGLDYPAALELVARSARIQAGYLAGFTEPAGCHFFCKVPVEDVEEIVAEVAADGRWIEISAYLGPDIHGVSASLATIELVKARLTARGGWGFHTMNRPQHCARLAELRDDLAERVYRPALFSAARIPLLSDIDGRSLVDPAELRSSLLSGWVDPVRLSVTQQGLARAGIDRAHMVGPRNIIGRLVAEVCEVVTVTPDPAPVPC